MNSLGRSRASCALGLHDYHRRVIRTRRAARRGDDAWLAREHLQHLQFDVEVDVVARAGAAGVERMTEIEAAVFLPALLRLRRALGPIAPGSEPASWLAPLADALTILRVAAGDTRSWQPPPAEACT